MKKCDIKEYIKELTPNNTLRIRLNEEHNRIFDELHNSKQYRLFQERLYESNSVDKINKGRTFLFNLNQKYGVKVAAFTKDNRAKNYLFVNVKNLLPSFKQSLQEERYFNKRKQEERDRGVDNEDLESDNLNSPNIEIVEEETERISLEGLQQVNQKAATFLENFGFKTKVLPSLQTVSIWNAMSATDMLEKVIYVKEGEVDSVYSLEASYVIFNLLGKKNILRKQIIETIHLMPGYKEKREAYLDKYPEYYIKELIAVEYLRDKFKSAHTEALEGNSKIKSEDATSKNQKGERSQLKYYALKFKKLWFDFLNVFFKRGQKRFVNTSLNEIVNNVLENNTKLFSLNNETNSANFILNQEQENLLNFLFEIGLSVSGSYSLSKQGQLKRKSNEISDFDFYVPYDKVITVFEDIKSKYPKTKILADYKGIYKDKARTVTLDIEGFKVDLFIPVDLQWSKNIKTIEIEGKKHMYWKNIFDAKLRIGSKKHLRDLAGFIPNIPEQTTLDIVGQRHFNFEAYIPTVNSIVEQIQNLPENHTEDDVIQIYADNVDSLPEYTDIETLEDLVNIRLADNTENDTTDTNEIVQEYSGDSFTSSIQDGYVRQSNYSNRTVRNVTNEVKDFKNKKLSPKEKLKLKNKLKGKVESLKTRTETLEESKIISEFQKIESNNVLEKTLKYLANKFDSHYELYADESDNRKGYVKKTGATYTVFINAAKATSDTPYHEFGHIFLELIRRNNIQLFSKLVEEITYSPLGREIIKINEEVYPEYNYEEIVEESMVDVLGKLSQKSFEEISNTVIEEVFSMNISQIPDTTSFTELAKILSYKIEKIDFDNTEKVESIVYEFEAEIKGELEKYTATFSYSEYNKTIDVSFKSSQGYDTKDDNPYKILPKIVKGISEMYPNVDYRYISFSPVADTTEPLKLSGERTKERTVRQEGPKRLIIYNLFAKRIFGAFSLLAEQDNRVLIPIPEMFRNFRENSSETFEQRERKIEIKQGVEKLFNENPELANQVYEALGFKEKVKNRNNAFIETISNIKSSKTGEKISLHKIFPHIADAFVTKTKDNKYYVEHTEDLFNEQEFENYLLDRFKPTEKETDVRYLGITPQQKQQALQFYSQYLESLNKLNTNPVLQGNQEVQINESEITYTDENGNPCAAAGLKPSKFQKGGNWEIIKEFKGKSHSQGGIDIEIGKGGIKMSNKQGKFEAKFGLVIPKNN